MVGLKSTAFSFPMLARNPTGLCCGPKPKDVTYYRVRCNAVIAQSFRGNRMVRKIFLFVAFLGLSACAVGNEHNFSNLDSSIFDQATVPLAVGVHDQRSFVLSGEKTSDFVGLSRGGYGNPFDVTTVSGLSLAEDILDSVVAALRDKGSNATPVSLAFPLSPAEAVDRLIETGRDRLVLVTIKAFKSDTFVNVRFVYNVVLQVFDGSGGEVASSQVSGDRNLGGSFMNPPSHAKKAVPKAYNDIMDELFSQPQIRAAMSGPTGDQ